MVVKLMFQIHQAARSSKNNQIKEPYVKSSIMVPNDYVGSVMELCQKKEEFS